MDIVKSIVAKQRPWYNPNKVLYFQDWIPIENKHLLEQYTNTTLGNEKILFHGASIQNLEGIARNGVDLFHQGYMEGDIGAGFYLTDLIFLAKVFCPYNETQRDTHFTLLVCRVRLGNCLHQDQDWFEKDMAQVKGYDSHSSPCGNGNQYCIFNTNQVLPIAYLHLSTNKIQ